MPSQDIIGPPDRESERNRAIIAGSRRLALYGVRRGNRAASVLIATNTMLAGGPEAGAAAARMLPSGPDQLARDFAEIEQAAAILRRVDPSLDVFLPGARGFDGRRVVPVWVLIGSIWI